MYLLPAIDVLGGKVVRLEKGDYAKVTVYNDDPIAQAQAFQEAGAEWIHVVDLDGARSGIPENAAIIEGIVRATSLKVEVGGGIRTLDTLKRMADKGAARMVLGTVLVNDPDLARAAIELVGASRLTAGIDAKGGEVALSGWVEGSGVAASKLAQLMGQAGFLHLVYTDIARDGMRTGLDPRAYAEIAEAFGHPVIASGGLATVDDIYALAPLADCIEGVITGRAIYEGTLSVQEGVAACQELS